MTVKGHNCSRLEFPMFRILTRQPLSIHVFHGHVYHQSIRATMHAKDENLPSKLFGTCPVCQEMGTVKLGSSDRPHPKSSSHRRSWQPHGQERIQIVGHKGCCHLRRSTAMLSHSQVGTNLPRQKNYAYIELNIMGFINHL